MRNRFDALTDDSQTAAERYERFTVANKDVTSELIPQATGRKSDLINKDPRVFQVREKLRSLYRRKMVANLMNMPKEKLTIHMQL